MRKIKTVLLSLLIGTITLLGMTSCLNFSNPNIDNTHKEDADKPDDSDNKDDDIPPEDDNNPDDQEEDNREKYSITTLPVEHGSIRCNFTSASEGDWIEIKFSPENYKYYLSNVYLNNKDHDRFNDKYITMVRNDTLETQMTDGPLIISAEFFKYDEYDAVKDEYDNYYENLNGAIASQGNNFQITSNVTSLNNDIIISKDKDITLDLNGNTLNCLEYSIYVYGSLTILNGNINGNIEIGDKENDYSSSLILKDGVNISYSEEENIHKSVITLNNKSSYFSMDRDSSLKGDEFAHAVYVNAGKVEIDGSLNSEASEAIYINPSKENNEFTEVTLKENSKVTGYLIAISITGGNLIVKGKIYGSLSYDLHGYSIEGGGAINVIPTSYNISITNVTISSSAYIYSRVKPGMYINGGNTNIEGKIETDFYPDYALLVEGGIVRFNGEISCQDYGILVIKNENSLISPKLFIEDNALVSSIVLNGGYLEMNGGNINGTGFYKGITIYGGDCVINDGEINGDLVAYSEDEDRFKYDINLEIFNAYIVGEVRLRNYNENLTITATIHGGYFISKTNNGFIDIYESNRNCKIIHNINYANVKFGIKILIDGISDYGKVKVLINNREVDDDNAFGSVGDKIKLEFISLDNNYKVKKLIINDNQIDLNLIKDNIYELVLTESGLYIETQFYNSNYTKDAIKDDSGIYYETVNEAVECGSRGLTLLADIIIDQDLYINDIGTNNDFNINLNGHDINMYDDTKIYIDNNIEFYIDGEGNINGGNFSKEGSLININCDYTKDIISYFRSVYIDEDVTINVKSKNNIKVSGINFMSSGNSIAKSYNYIQSKINIENGYGIIVDKTISSIPSDIKPNFILEDAEIISNNGSAIYIDGNCIFEIGNGIYRGTDSALEAHDGEIYIEGGYLSATSEKFEDEDNVKGVGIVAKPNYNTDMKININGYQDTPTVSGVKAIYARNEYDNSILNIYLNHSKLISLEEALDTDKNSLVTVYIGGGFKTTVSIKEHSPSIYDYVVVNTFEELNKALNDDFIERIYLGVSFVFNKDYQLVIKGKNKEIFGTNRKIKSNKLKEDDIHTLYVYNPIKVEATNCEFHDINIVNINDSDSELLNSSTISLEKTSYSLSLYNAHLSVDYRIEKHRIGILLKAGNESEYTPSINMYNSSVITTTSNESYGYAFYFLNTVYVYLDDSNIKAFCIAYFNKESIHSNFDVVDSTLYAVNKFKENDLSSSDYGAFIFEYLIDQEKGYRYIGVTFYRSEVNVTILQGYHKNYLIHVVNDTTDENNTEIALYFRSTASNIKCRYFSPSSVKFKNILNLNEGKYVNNPSDYINKDEYEVIALSNDPDGYYYEVIRK